MFSPLFLDTTYICDLKALHKNEEKESPKKGVKENRYHRMFGKSWVKWPFYSAMRVEDGWYERKVAILL